MNSSNVETRKSFVVTWLYSLLFGTFGLDRFYLGQPGLGLTKFLTFGGFGIWSLFDLLQTLSGGRKDKDGNPLSGQGDHLITAWVVSAAYSIFVLFLVLAFASTVVGAFGFWG